MARNDRRSRALLRGLRRQARRGNLTAREQRDLLDQEELFRQARRENAPLTTAAVLAGAGLLGTPGGRAALAEFTGMDPQSRLRRQMEKDEAENLRGMRKDALDDMREMSRLQDELDRIQVAEERLREIEEGSSGEEETPTEIVDEPKTIEAKAVPMEDVAESSDAESSDREIDEIVMLPEVEVSEPLEGFFILPSGAMSSQPAPGALFVPPGTQEEQDSFIKSLGGADMLPEKSNLEGFSSSDELLDMLSKTEFEEGEELTGRERRRANRESRRKNRGAQPVPQPAQEVTESGQTISLIPKGGGEPLGKTQSSSIQALDKMVGPGALINSYKNENGETIYYTDSPRRQEHGGIVDPERRADRVYGRAQDTLMRLVEADQAGKEKLTDRLLGRYMRQLQRHDDLKSKAPFEGGLDDYLAPPPGQLGPIQPMEPYSNPELDEQMEEYENKKVKPSGSSMKFGGQTPKMQDFMQKIARKYGIK